MSEPSADELAAAAALQAAQDSAAARLPELLSAVRAQSPEQAAADSSARVAFWRAFFELPAWLVIARGESDQPTPFAVYHGDRPTILVFSSATAAREVGVAAGLTEEQASLLVAVPMPQAVDWIASFGASGVQLIQVDAHLDGGLVMPVAHLPAMRADLLGA